LRRAGLVSKKKKLQEFITFKTVLFHQGQISIWNKLKQGKEDSSDRNTFILSKQVPHFPNASKHGALKSFTSHWFFSFSACAHRENF